VEVTAQVENAQAALVEPPDKFSTLTHGVLNIHGIKPAADALFLMKVEETHTPLTITPIIPLMLDFGKSTR
jgi:hypothetical protein